MNNFILHLKSNNDSKDLSLFLKEPDDIQKDYFDNNINGYVYNDYLYSLSVTDEFENVIQGEKYYVNNEIVNKKDRSYIFLECFGVVKIEVIINGLSYITQNLRVVMKKDSINESIINMIDYIYENCDKYLYEEHKNSKSGFGIKPNINVSIDSKLSLLKEIYDVYIKCYNILKNSAQTKLINTDKIGDFNELQLIGASTIKYIVNHPEELLPVSYNSGISVNKQYYEPRKTLVKSVAYSYDIYENQVVVGFLKEIIEELEEIKSTVEDRIRLNTSPYKSNGYIDSAYYIYTKNRKVLTGYLTGVNFQLSKFEKLYIEYKNILNVSDYSVTSSPRYTNIFRQIKPYNIIFEKILKWFNCGDYDLLKSDLLLSFISISKLYEYFCLLKLLGSLEKCGYNLVSGKRYKYNENEYYSNTNYNNTFLFSKGDINIRVLYQPVVSGRSVLYGVENEIGLFRNTTISISSPDILAILDDIKPRRGNFYAPDYLIEITHDNRTNYYILDAKHSTPDNIKRNQLPSLIFKYLFSISALYKSGNVAGMCIICGKTEENYTENVHDVADKLNITLTPDVQICSVTGYKMNDDNDLINYINRIENGIVEISV